MYDNIQFKDFLAAHALILLHYGSVENTRAHGAYPSKEKKPEAPEEPMTVEEPVVPKMSKAAKVPAKQKELEVTAVRAGPSGMSLRRNACKKSTKRRRSVSPVKGKKLFFPNGGVRIGSGATIVPVEAYKKLRLQNYKFATRSLLDALFEKSVLATSSVTGKPSPAFPNLPAKKKLDPVIVSDITEEVMKRYKNVTRDQIRLVITTKCADEAKIARNLRIRNETGVLPKKRGRRSNRRVSDE